jgi:hypothetical protein
MAAFFFPLIESWLGRQIAEKLGFRCTAPEGAPQFKELPASLKRCPDTKLEFFSSL